MKKSIGVVVLLAACSSPVPAGPDVGIDATSTAGDSGVDASSSPDAPTMQPDSFTAAVDGGLDAPTTGDAAPLDARTEDAGPPQCAWDAPWETHSLVSGLATASGCEFTPWLFDDELSVIVPRGCASLGTDLFIGTRRTTADPFTGFTLVPASRPDHHDWWPSLSADGLDLYWQRVPTGGTYYDPVVSHRGSSASAFTMDPIPVPNVWLTGNDGAPRVGPDGMYTHEERAAGHLDLAFAPSDGSGGFMRADEIVELNSDRNDMVPTVSADGLTIWWSSNRPDYATSGDRDILVAHRAALGMTWGVPRHEPTLSSAETDEPAWVSPDNCRLYYSRQGTGAITSDVWMATRSP